MSDTAPGPGGRKASELEAAVARVLTRLPVGYQVFRDIELHHGDPTTVDHLVIGPSGAWLIDTRAWAGELRAGDGTLWRGGTPIRDEIEHIERSAETVAARLGVDVNPMLCFVGTVLPRPAQMVERTRVVTLDALVDHVVGATPVLLPNTVEMLGHRARTMETEPPPARPGIQPPLPWDRPSPGIVVIPEPDDEPTDLARPRTGVLRTIVAMIVVAALVLGAVSALLIATSDMRSAPAPTPRSTARPTPTAGSGDVVTTVDCPVPGTGWTFQARRTLRPSAPRARVTANVNGLPAYLGDLGAGQRSDQLRNLGPDQLVTLTVETLDAAGQRLGRHDLSITTPPQPC